MGEHDRRRPRPGNALYADIGSIPNVSDAQGPGLRHRARRRDLHSCSGCRCSTARARRATGAPTPTRWSPASSARAHLPHLFRNDYVTNSNDSYWLSNPHAAADRLRADHRRRAHARAALRTRIGLIMTQARVDGTTAWGAGFTRQDMQNMVFSDRQYAGELVRDDAGGDVPLDARRNRAQLIRRCPCRWATRATCSPPGTCTRTSTRTARSSSAASGTHALGRRAARPWVRPFDVVSDPVHTPNTLDTTNPAVRLALGDAIHDLQSAPHPARTRRSAAASAEGPRRAIPIHGGPGDPNGDFNAIYSSFTGRAPASPRARRLVVRAGGDLEQRALPGRRARSSPTRSRATPARPSTRIRPSSSAASSGCLITSAGGPSSGTPSAPPPSGRTSAPARSRRVARAARPEAASAGRKRAFHGPARTP